MQKLHEYGILIFTFFLPTFEAPKHIGFCMMAVGFTGMRLYKKDTRDLQFSPLDWWLLGVLVTSTISTLLNLPSIDSFKGIKYVLYYLSTFWMLYHSHYNKKIITQIPIALVAGSLAGICIGGYELIHSQSTLPKLEEFELVFTSINSVSRSGAFNATILFISVGVLMDNTCGFSQKTTLFFSIAWFITSVCVFIMGGRGNAVAIICTYGFLSIPLFKYKKFLFFMAIQGAISIIVIIFLLSVGTSLQGRFQHLLSTNFTVNVSDMPLHDQMRYDYWRIGVAQISQNPSLFGIGPRNFKSIQIENLDLSPPLLKESLQLINDAPQHAHNWLLTKWAEDGIVGITFFIIFVLSLFYGLWQHRPAQKTDKVHWVWVASLSAILTAIISGFFNSAFTHENGWLTYFLMGLGASHITPKQKDKKIHADSHHRQG